MPKYKGAYREELDKDEASYSEELEREAGNDGGQAPAAGGEDDTWKQRYSDLRRHQQQQKQRDDDEKADLRRQLDEATREQIRFPKTKEEVEEWTNKYPEVAQIIQSIAGMEAQKQVDPAREELNSIRDETTKAKKQRAYNQLLEMHPDFNELRETDEFQSWIGEQPGYIQDALYKNSTDAHAAARAVDLYKADTDTGKKRPKADQKESREEAARGVDTKGGSAPAGGKGGAKFSESQVQAMSDKEYEDNEDAIITAMREGKFNYDVSGAAR